MAGIIYDANLIKVYEKLSEMCEFAGESPEWGDKLWEAMLTERQLYEEFVYFLQHHTFLDRMKCCGYSMIDLYFLQLEKYNRLHDTGKTGWLQLILVIPVIGAIALLIICAKAGDGASNKYGDAVTE